MQLSPEFEASLKRMLVVVAGSAEVPAGCAGQPRLLRPAAPAGEQRRHQGEHCGGLGARARQSGRVLPLDFRR